MPAIQYDELRPRWKYVLTGACEYEIPRELYLDLDGDDCNFILSHDRDLPVAVIYPNKILGMRGYRWDGATGATDHPKFQRASLFHDIGCQAIDEALIPPWNQARIDRIMYLISREDGFNVIRALVRYGFVRVYREIKTRNMPWPR